MNLPVLLGGEAVRKIPFERRRTMGEEEKKAVIQVLDSDILSGFIGGKGQHFLGGKKVKEFEKLWAENYGFKHAISVNSWTTGLMVAVGAIGIEPGDEVICSPFTMSASATSILFYGGIPVFADIDSNNFCIDPKSIEKKITENTKAIMVVHIFGGPADMDEIIHIANKYNLRIIEDAAQAPGVYYKGKPVGAIGDIGGFSLNYHKHIHTGEGGMIVTNDDKLAHKAQLIRNHGENLSETLSDEELINCIGSNYRLTELQAAIGIEQLKKLEDILKTRKVLSDYLNNELAKFDFLKTYQMNWENSSHAYYVYPIKFDGSKIGISRSLFVKAVNAEFPLPNGYESVPLTEGYVPPLYWNKIYQKQIAIGSKGFPFNFIKHRSYDYSIGSCPVVERMYSHELICSPLVRKPLTIEDMQDLIKAITKIADFSKELSKAYANEDTEIFSPNMAADKTDTR